MVLLNITAIISSSIDLLDELWRGFGRPLRRICNTTDTNVRMQIRPLPQVLSTKLIENDSDTTLMFDLVVDQTVEHPTWNRDEILKDMEECSWLEHVTGQIHAQFSMRLPRTPSSTLQN